MKKSQRSRHITNMSSGLRFSMSASYPQSSPVAHHTTASPPPKKQKMSLTQTYYLAHTARGKLSTEASRADHNLHRLVGHANLLDGLMLDLADAEREQESWFHQTVMGANTASDDAKAKHIQWADTIPEEAIDEEWDAESSDTESDSDDDEETPSAHAAPRRRESQQPSATVTAMEVDEDMEEDEDYEDELALTRTSSHPPELLDESDSDSEDDAMPPSPPQTEIPLHAFSEKQRQAIATTSFYPSIPEPSDSHAASLPPSEQASFFDEGYYLPQRQTAIVSAF